MDSLCNIRTNAVFCLLLVSILYGVEAQTSSPVTGFDCWFEISIMDPLCGMQQDSADDFDWVRQTSDNDQVTYPQPSVDHSTEISHGHYLHAKTGSDQSSGNRARLNMPWFVMNPDPQCVEFFYQISGGDNPGDLAMYQWARSSSAPSKPTWTTSAETGDVWTRALYTIDPQNADYTLYFEAIASTGTSTYIALDDVRVKDGACPVSDLTCDFENDICGFSQDTTDNNDWFRAQGSTSSIYTGPSIDHTLGTDQGWYVYLEASYMNQGFKARIVSPVMQGVSDGSLPACLTFFYHMYGDTIGDLKVYVQAIDAGDMGEAVWSLTGNRGDKWRAAEVDLNLATDFMVIFEGTRGLSYDGDIALDDIGVLRGSACPGVPPTFRPITGKCDFEEVELCGYVQDQTDDVDWVWQNRANQYTFFGPTFDHTTATEFGFYMFLYGDVGHRKTARLISPLLPQQSGDTCLGFYLYLYGNDQQKLNVYCTPNGDVTADEEPMFNITGNYGDQWNLVRWDIPESLTPCKVVFEGMTGIHSRDDLALDDVDVYHSEQCPTTMPGFFDPTTTPPTSVTFRCDFEDENDPTCGWTQSYRDGFDWTLYSGPSRDYNSGPESDHTKQTDDGHYMLIDSYDEIPANSRAEFISPLVSRSTSNRCFSFWYYMKGQNTNFLNIYIVPYGSLLPMDPAVQLYGNLGDMWMEGKLSLPPSDRSFYISIEGTVGAYPYSADIAIDDLVLDNAMCNAPTSVYLPSVVNCDFESGLCGYRQGLDERDDDFDWFLNSGPTGTDGSGPVADHTLGNDKGHYLYMEASQPRKPGDKAQVISPVITRFNETNCLEFFYHMSGADTASLIVKQRGDYYPDQELARITGPVANEWMAFNVDVGRKYGAIEVVFEGTVGNNFRADIAIDDITMTPEPCGGYPSEVTCRFEYGLASCGFELAMDGDAFDWMWYDALAGEMAPVDWSGSGSYIYANASRSLTNSSAVIKTSSLTLQQNDHCIYFDYALSGDMRLDILSEGRDGTRSTLRTLSKGTTMSNAEIKISRSNSPNEYKVVIIASPQSAYKGLAVVDNVIVDYCGRAGGGTGYEPVSQGDDGTTVAIVLGVLLAVAACLVIGLGVLHYRGKKTDNYPATISYKTDTNGQNAIPVPDLSKDPGIDNPNYNTANLTVA